MRCTGAAAAAVWRRLIKDTFIAMGTLSAGASPRLHLYCGDPRGDVRSLAGLSDAAAVCLTMRTPYRSQMVRDVQGVRSRCRWRYVVPQARLSRVLPAAAAAVPWQHLQHGLFPHRRTPKPTRRWSRCPALLLASATSSPATTGCTQCLVLGIVAAKHGGGRDKDHGWFPSVEASSWATLSVCFGSCCASRPGRVIPFWSGRC